MTPLDSEPVCDLQSVAEVKRQLFRRWLRPFASMILTAMLIATAAAFILYWLLAGLSPSVSGPSIRACIVGSSIAALLICSVPIGRMLWLDLQIHRRLDDMERRIAEGELVRASELRL